MNTKPSPSLSLTPLIFGVSAAFIFSGCATVSSQPRQTAEAKRKAAQDQLEARATMEAEIAKEPLGNYFIGRRYYKVDYKMWGYVRSPRQSWADSRLVMLNEDHLLAPDRAANTIGSDNGYEYILHGKFSGQQVYEPAANQPYPEFVLRKATLRTKTPGPIFQSPKALDPEERYYPNPY